MALPFHAQTVYVYLISKVVDSKQVVTYGEVSEATGVPLGEGGGAVKHALAKIFHACDEQRLPPLTSIVVQEATCYDPTLRHGMPGGGYLVAAAESPNQARRREDPGLAAWQRKPRPDDVDTWKMQGMIEAHQDSVWEFNGAWPDVL